MKLAEALRSQPVGHAGDRNKIVLRPFFEPAAFPKSRLALLRALGAAPSRVPPAVWGIVMGSPFVRAEAPDLSQADDLDAVLDALRHAALHSRPGGYPPTPIPDRRWWHYLVLAWARRHLALASWEALQRLEGLTGWGDTLTHGIGDALRELVVGAPHNDDYDLARSILDHEPPPAGSVAAALVVRRHAIPQTEIAGAEQRGSVARPPELPPAIIPKPNRTRLFISYSHRDKRWLQQLMVHLKLLERQRIIDV